MGGGGGDIAVLYGTCSCLVIRQLGVTLFICLPFDPVACLRAKATHCLMQERVSVNK